jgi:hypothetical protein
MFRLLGASVELVRGRASTYGVHNRTAALLDREPETGPDLPVTRTWCGGSLATGSGLWQSSCAPRSGSRASLRNVCKYEIEFNLCVRRARGRL